MLNESTQEAFVRLHPEQIDTVRKERKRVCFGCLLLIAILASTAALVVVFARRAKSSRDLPVAFGVVSQLGLQRNCSGIEVFEDARHEDLHCKWSAELNVSTLAQPTTILTVSQWGSDFTVATSEGVLTLRSTEPVMSMTMLRFAAITWSNNGNGDLQGITLLLSDNLIWNVSLPRGGLSLNRTNARTLSLCAKISPFDAAECDGYPVSRPFSDRGVELEAAGFANFIRNPTQTPVPAVRVQSDSRQLLVRSTFSSSSSIVRWSNRTGTWQEIPTALCAFDRNITYDSITDSEASLWLLGQWNLTAITVASTAAHTRVNVFAGVLNGVPVLILTGAELCPAADCVVARFELPWQNMSEGLAEVFINVTAPDVPRFRHGPAVFPSGCPDGALESWEDVSGSLYDLWRHQIQTQPWATLLDAD